MRLRSHFAVFSVLACLLIFSLNPVYAQEETSIDDLVVVNMTEIDMRAGPARTAAYLSPDGSQFAYIDGLEAICFYSLPDVIETQCIDFPEDVGPNLDSVQWSPEGRYLVMESHDFLRMLLDTDLLLVDTVEGTVTNVTDDGFDDPILSEEVEGTAFIDLSPQWIAEEGFAFIRYEATAGEFSQAALYTYPIQSGEAVKFTDFAQSQGRIDVYLFEVQAETEQYAFYLDQRSDDNYGIFLSENEEFPVPIAASTDPTSRYGGIGLLSLSPDGQYLLNYDSRMMAMAGSGWQDAENSIAQLVDIDERDALLIDDERFVTEAGWSPEGNGLVYVNYDIELGGGGLFITSSVGEPGRMILSFEEMDIQFVSGTTPMRRQPIMWASNNTILVSQFPSANLLLIELGTEE